ncbi:MAG: hydrogenase nickel incorporation protein HypB [Longimicrobiales bacterium]|nr:hydrogenase nickel incorporation protein HypB [Longimicrobiales bacterium]
MNVRRIEVRERIMERNDAIARDVRALLRTHGVAALNLVSSPGSGKTLLLERTLRDLGERMRMAVITGDVQTQNDADRIARWTDDLVQAVVTGGACHLDARQVSNALEVLDLDSTDLVFVENVGNLVCPASWDLGEEAKVVLFSVTEGEDKPLKYPKMFQKASYAVLTKVDLLPHVPFDEAQAVAYAREVNPELRFFRTSSVDGTGLEEWYDFLLEVGGGLARSRGVQEAPAGQAAAAR